MAIPPTDINWIEKYGNMDWGNAMKTGDFGLTDAERDSQLQRTIAINNQEMAKAQAKRAAEQAAVNQPAQGAPMPGYRPAPMMGGTYPYQIPNRNFTWQTDPQEQMALAGRMNRQDLQPLLGSGEYGPLAGQQYQYGGGRTQINYGPGGGSGFGSGYGGFPPWQTQPVPPWQPPVPPIPPTIYDPPPTPPRPPVTIGDPPPVVPPIDERPPVVPPDWTPGPVPEGEEWNFRPEDFRGPLKNWTAPVNPYGTTAQGYQTKEQFENMQAFKQALAAQPMGTSPLLNTQGYTSTGLSTGRTGNEFGGMPTPAELAARQASVMPDDFGSGNPFADRQRAARLAPNYLTGQAPGSNLWDIGLGQRANFENPAARNFLRTPKRVDDAAIVSPQLRENLMFLGELRASDRPGQLDRTVRPAASPAVTGVDRGLQQEASRVAAKKQRAAVTQSQQREESRGRQEQENRAAAKKQREALESKSRAKAAEKNRVRGLAAEREKAAKAKAADARKKSLQAASAKAMKQAQARARNKKAEASRKKAMGSKNYSAYQARGKR